MTQRVTNRRAPQELRRGADSAHIYSLALSKHCEWLALSSDKGTVHVFALSPAVSTAAAAAAGEEGKRAGSPDGGALAPAGPKGGGDGDGAALQPAPRQNPTSLLSIVKVGRLTERAATWMQGA